MNEELTGQPGTVARLITEMIADQTILPKSYSMLWLHTVDQMVEAMKVLIDHCPDAEVQNRASALIEVYEALIATSAVLDHL